MNFDESIKYLYGLGNEVLAMKLGLENISKLLNALGNPHEKYLKVQIAGTNGKGSVCAFLESICLQAGMNVGMTTSPHLVSITERIKINGKEISEENFARYAAIVRETSEKLVKTGELETVPTFFEQVTAIALFAFAESGVELAILETGLGGRFDAVTAANAEIAAITPIDFDHQRILGETLAEIAAEKAAIIRADTKVAVANQPPEAMKVISERCAKFGVSPNLAAQVRTICTGGLFGRESDFPNKSMTNFETAKAKYENVSLGILGKHQIENAKVAIILAEILQEKFNITKENIIKGLQTARHRGRLEFNGKYLFDGAHNSSGTKALRDFLNESINQPITMIFGAMRDKNLTEIAEILFPKADKLILTKPDNPRSMETSDLAEFARNDEMYQTETVAEALKKAAEISDENDLILVTGSLYLIGEAQKILKM